MIFPTTILLSNKFDNAVIIIDEAHELHSNDKQTKILNTAGFKVTNPTFNNKNEVKEYWN